MSLTLRLSCALGALVGAVLLATPALANDGVPKPVQECLAEIRSATTEGVLAIRQNTQQTAQSIATLDENDAPEEALVAAAQQGREQTAQIASESRTQINALTQQCLDILEMLEAPVPAYRFVLSVRGVALDRIQHAARHSNRIISGALRQALADENEEGESTVDLTPSAL